MAAVELARMTVEEFLALPDDGVDRMLIDGEVRELGMTIRNRNHGRIEAKVSHFLQLWLSERPEPRGCVVTGETGFRLASGSKVGVDVAYVSPELTEATPEEAYFVGAPTLAVEILSPSDKQVDIEDKIAAYLDAGVPLVWIIQPRFRTITVYRPDADPRLFVVNDEITADPHLPGFRAAVADIFKR